LRYWDSSALVPAVFSEPSSGVLNELLREDTGVAVWWGTWVECAVTISRLKREGRLDEAREEETRVALDNLAENRVEIEPANDMRLLAMLVSKYHPLKAADALQLAAALRWCEGDTRRAGFVCLDDRLRRAASEEGFDVMPGLEPTA
jgi:predicted nucleic acid-binding protein